MPITFAKAPRSARAQLVGHLTELARESRPPMASLRIEELSHSEAQPVYSVPLDALAQGKLLAAARQTGWRYLLVKDNAAVAEAELPVARRGAKAAASRASSLTLTQGPFAGATVDALHAAERLSQVARADYELRLLNVPAVYLVALWLHRADDDILIPMGNPPAGLKRNEPYREAAVIAALREPAGRTMRFDEASRRRKPARVKRTKR